ncbi:MAG: dephospho-CoA kinase [Coriobacteriia bacterium]|nr:dephospho-CoA kinase [Coriobacteriia bacterium]
MNVIALTGGIGSGKSTAAEYFSSRGAVVVSLDEVARNTLTPGSAALAAVVAAFGEGVLSADGTLDRDALARRSFSSRQAAERLNAIVHPAVAREVGPALRELDMLPMRPEVVVIEVPLIVEAPVFAELADLVVAIEAPEEMRIARVVSRGMKEPDARARLACQATDAQRAELADDVIVNATTIRDFLSELERYWNTRAVPIASIE